MSYLEIKGGRLHYKTEGSPKGPAIVLSNSLGTNLSMWDGQMSALTQEFRVIRYDQRGHGLSDATSAPYTIESLARDVLALLDALAVDTAFFCGLSIGGLTGQWLGIHAPQRLKGLVLCNTSARIGTADSWNMRIAMAKQGGMESIVSGVLQRWYTADFARRNPAAVECTRQMLLHTPVKGYVGCCEALRDADLIAEVTQIKVPTLVLSGDEDPATSPEQGRFLASRIAGARYMELPASHLSNIEAAPEFNSALLGFLKGSAA